LPSTIAASIESSDDSFPARIVSSRELRAQGRDAARDDRRRAILEERIVLVEARGRTGRGRECKRGVEVGVGELAEGRWPGGDGLFVRFAPDRECGDGNDERGTHGPQV
jgi:hypothetical protein